MMMVQILKNAIAKQRYAIVDGLNMELDRHNIGSDTCQDKMILEVVKRAHGMMYTKLGSVTKQRYWQSSVQ